jgi:hypothetical protein
MRFRSVLLTAVVLAVGLLSAPSATAQDLLIPMDAQQENHLKAYGAVYATLQEEQTVDWLLNYRGGSFLTEASETVREELQVRGVSFTTVSAGQASKIIAEVEADGSNKSVVPLEKAPEIAVYAPEGAVPWDDAVRLAWSTRRSPRHHLRRRGSQRRPRVLRLAAPSPRGLHRAVRQVHPLPQRALVHPEAEQGGGGGQESLGFAR